MRVLSLVPSATEIVYALGAQDLLVGVTHECDHPAEASRKPAVTRTTLPSGSDLSTSDIDRLVAEKTSRGELLYEVDADLVGNLRPDVILAQDLCAVCAVPSGDITAALARLGSSASVLSLDPEGLDGVLACILDVGRALGVPERAALTAEVLSDRIERVRSAAADLARVRVCSVEWDDPAYVGGHWVPEMVAAAGGTEVLGEPGRPSRRVLWDEVAAAAPDVVVYMPCGFRLPDAIAQARRLWSIPQFAATPAAAAGGLFAVDASAYFSRPGPRLVDGIEILARILHPETFGVPTPPQAARVPSG